MTAPKHFQAYSEEEKKILTTAVGTTLHLRCSNKAEGRRIANRLYALRGLLNKEAEKAEAFAMKNARLADAKKLPGKKLWEDPIFKALQGINSLSITVDEDGTVVVGRGLLAKPFKKVYEEALRSAGVATPDEELGARTKALLEEDNIDAETSAIESLFKKP